MRETAELATTMKKMNLPSTETTTTPTTGLDLDRDVLSEIFSRLLDPQDLATVPCVCRHWRRAAEEEGEEDRNWRSAAESLGLGLEGEEEEQDEEEEEKKEGKEGAGSAAAVAATLDRRALRSGAPALPAPPSSTWKARVRAAWPELCFECRLPDSGRRRSKQQQRGGGGEGEAATSPLSSSPFSSSPFSPLRPPRTLSIRHCHSCSSASAVDCQRRTKTRLVDTPTALRILRNGGGESEGEDGRESDCGNGDDDDDDDDDEEDGQKSDDELLLLLSRLPRSLDVRPQDPRFRTVELFRRRDVRALARGFERDIYFWDIF